jgi:hypothetical protein
LQYEVSSISLSAEQPYMNIQRSLMAWFQAQQQRMPHRHALIVYQLLCFEALNHHFFEKFDKTLLHIATLAPLVELERRLDKILEKISQERRFSTNVDSFMSLNSYLNEMGHFVNQLVYSLTKRTFIAKSIQFIDRLIVDVMRSMKDQLHHLTTTAVAGGDSIDDDPVNTTMPSKFV